MQIKAAIFDVDGTLLDSLGIWEKADEEYLSRRGIKPEKGLEGGFRAGIFTAAPRPNWPPRAASAWAL